MKQPICNGSASTFTAKTTQYFAFPAPETGDFLSFSCVGEEDTTGLCKGVTAVARALLCGRMVAKLSQVTSSSGLKGSQENLRGLNLLLTFLEPPGSVGSDLQQGWMSGCRVLDEKA